MKCGGGLGRKKRNVVVVGENIRNLVVVYSFTILGWYHYK